MELKTGIGYIVKNGLKVGKFDLPIGFHKDPTDSSDFVEVKDRKEFEAIVLDPEPLTKDQEAFMIDAQIQQHRNDFIDALMADDAAKQATIKTSVADLQSQKDAIESQVIDTPIEVKK